MEELRTGKTAPDFCLPGYDSGLVCLEKFRGKWVVVYFYPRDNTSGCTIEAIDFSKAISTLGKMNTAVLGISPDSVKSHCGFRDKHLLKVTLLSDPDRAVIKEYGAWGMKKMAGREGPGVVRSTLIINPEGKIAWIWRQVKVIGHIDEVIKTLGTLQKSS
jgi:peroxiredoxin Q/BCP